MFAVADLKKLIKYEKSPRESTEIHIQAGPSSVNIQRLFEAHTVASKTKQKENPITNRQRVRPTTIDEVSDEPEKNTPQRSTDVARHAARKDSNTTIYKPVAVPRKNKILQKLDQGDKENLSLKSKMWIRPKDAPLRPKSALQASRKPSKKTDPVSLYHSYQKDWERFKSNICESSHSDLRWSIREKMMGNN